MADGLTDKRQRFCEEYLVDMNGTQAAIRAGYKHNAARQTASEILSLPCIQDELARLKQELSNRTALTADFVVNGLMEEAQYCSEGSSHGARVKAYEVLGKYKDLNLWKESLELSVDETMAERINERFNSQSHR